MKLTSTSKSVFGTGFSIAQQRQLAPWPIPANVTTQEITKNGYHQLKYTWTRKPWRYEARWHSRVPSAKFIAYPSWRLDRFKPGQGFGPDAAPRIAQTWVAGKWLPTRQVRYLTSQANAAPSPETIAVIVPLTQPLRLNISREIF